MLCAYVICIVDMFICVPNYGSMSGRSRCSALGPSYVIMGMVCGSMGKLTKLRAYNYQFWFQIFQFSK